MTSLFTPDGWHQRFLQQSLWTQQVRQFLWQQHPITPADRILEVGCGTGVIAASTRQQTGATVCGLDIRLDFLQLAQIAYPAVDWTTGDAYHLPYADSTFKAVYCHFLLLWLAQPLAALKEMVRVVQPGGIIMALAEPDYGGRIDYPESLVELGILQQQSLHKQGADPLMGRKLNGLFTQAGLKHIETGLLGGHWTNPPTPEAWESEWTVLQSDLGEAMPPVKLAELRTADAAAWKKGERVLFIPTFFATGQKPAVG